MSLTSNFTFCVQLSIDAVRQIFHLAFKNESQCFPHNVGPFTRDFAGRTATVTVTVLDDESRPADLSFADDKHMSFSLPFDVTVEIPDAPDPSLSRLTLQALAAVPGRLDSWDADGEPVLGLRFDDVTPDAVEIVSLAGVPVIGEQEILRSIHARYDSLPHRYTTPAPGGGTAELLLYDGTRDTTLVPAYPGNPPITATLENPPEGEFLKVTAPIHVDVPTGYGFDYVSFGTITFFRAVTRTDTTITVTMGTEPGADSLKTVVALDNAGPGHDQVVAALTPMARNAVNGFGTITEPAFSQNAAESLLKTEIASYLNPLSFSLYTPRSNDPAVVLTTPVGFLIPAAGVLAILLNRRSGTADDDVAPDAFLGGRDVALGVAAAYIIERSDEVIEARFPGVNTDSGHELHTDSGDATLWSCHAAPADDGAHDESPGHLWVTGEAEVHIDCWPDPDVSFEGPVFIDATRTDGPEGCSLTLQPRAGEFDVDQSCCDVLLDLLIPVVGWIMLAVVENLIDEVGGEIATETAEAETQLLAPIPKVVIGIAQIECCLDGLRISSQGFVLPGDLSIRRSGTSFEDLEARGCAPRPDQP